jgi:transposase-like protein
VRLSTSRGVTLPETSAFAGFRFPAEVIVVAVRWYLRYNLSYRDVQELLLERGIEVDHVTVFRWVQRFTPLLADAARFTRHAPGDRWFVNETYVSRSAAERARRHCCSGSSASRAARLVRIWSASGRCRSK